MLGAYSREFEDGGEEQAFVDHTETPTPARTSRPMMKMLYIAVFLLLTWRWLRVRVWLSSCELPKFSVCVRPSETAGVGFGESTHPHLARVEARCRNMQSQTSVRAVLLSEASKLIYFLAFLFFRRCRGQIRQSNASGGPRKPFFFRRACAKVCCDSPWQ